MPLTDMNIRKLNPGPKMQRHFDGNGLYLEISPAGGKHWRLKYRFDGKEKRLSFGEYPMISLKEARLKRDDARKMLAGGLDPGEVKKAEKEAISGTFEAVALEWLLKYSPTWTPDHADKIKRRLERDIFPWLGARPIGQITPPELLTVLRRVEDRGRIETAHRAMANCGQVFRYAIATGRAERDISQDLRGAIPPVKKKHLASIIDPNEIGLMLRAFDEYDGLFVTKCALRLSPLVFVRPGELRQAEWSEINFEAKEWRIPEEKMKMRIMHIVPLSRQAIEILEELRPATGQGRYLFPGARTAVRPMSNATVLNALRRMGYSKDDMTAHGFRSIASTHLNEIGYNRDWIERQLAHGESNTVRAAYNYAEYLPERRKMMQAWADYLDGLKMQATFKQVG